MGTSGSIEAFLRGRPHAVVGASRDRSKFGNKVLRAYLRHEMPVFAVNPREEGEIEGVPVFPSLAALPEPVHGISIIDTRVSPQISGHVTVPVLYDTKRDTIVSNESAEIIRMFNTAFDEITGNTDDYWPADLHGAIGDVNGRIYDTFNNGVYKAGFATTQSAYDEAVVPLFETLDWLEGRLGSQRYLMGDRLTEADWRLLPTLLRFDSVYHLHFKCNRKRIIDYPHLWAYTRELYQVPGIAETMHLDHIVRHYHYSHETINPNRIIPIIPINPVLNFRAPHGRG